MTDPHTQHLLELARERVAEGGARVRLVSVVLPLVEGRGDVSAHMDVLRGLPVACELVVVGEQPEGDQASAAPGDVAVRRVTGDPRNWGASVRAGLAVAEGDALCYAHPARTSPAALELVLGYALAYPGTVIRVNRRSRDSVFQRLGSLAFNAECRALFGIPVWDVNGTPKIFPRRFGRLLELEADGDLVDLEFTLVCDEERYPVVEIPVQEPRDRGRTRGMGVLRGLALYAAVVAYKRRRGRADASA